MCFRINSAYCHLPRSQDSPFHNVNLGETHGTHVVVVVRPRVLDILEVVGEEPTPKSLFLVCLDDFILNI